MPVKYWPLDQVAEFTAFQLQNCLHVSCLLAVQTNTYFLYYNVSCYSLYVLLLCRFIMLWTEQKVSFTEIKFKKKIHILFFRSKNMLHLSIKYNDKLDTTFDNRL